MDFEKSMRSFLKQKRVSYLIIYWAIFFSDLLTTFGHYIMQNKCS